MKKQVLLNILTIMVYVCTQAQTVSYQPLYNQATFDAKTIDQSKSIGVVAGSHGVNLGGNATYTIPIHIPMGINGMQPSVSINYNSGAGNGLLGYGWALSATSSITYDRKNLYHDGVLEPAYINAGSPFVLDGQRLIPISGSNGANGTEYRTEQESFSRIKSYGSSGGCSTCPNYFIVEQKDGIVIEYGTLESTNITKLKNTNGTLPIIWYLSKVKDLYGNYIEYKYKIQNGEHVLDEILYTKNDANAALELNSIKFEYAERFDKNAYYAQLFNQNSTEVKLNNLVTKISIKEEGKALKDYNLVYANDDFYSFLNEITEKSYDDNNNSEVLNSTIFKYGEDEVETIENNTCNIAQNSNSEILFCDYNGDSYKDIIKLTCQNTNGIKTYTEISIYINNKTITPYNNTPYTKVFPTNLKYKNAIITDLDGDDYDEVMFVVENYNTSGVLAGVNIKGFSFYSSSNYFGTASVEQLSTNNTSTSKFEFIRRGDVNGDGKDEVISKLKHSGSNTIYYIHYTNAVQQFSATVLNQYSDIFIKDVDGDKKEEIIVTIPFEFFNVYNQSGNLILTSDIIDFFDKNWVGDFNGDGNTEFFAHDFSNGLKIHYINKNEVVTKSYPNLFTEGINITQLNLKKELLLSNDFNNDGNADILHFYTPTNSNIPKYAIYFSNGVGFIRKEYIAPHNNNFIPLTTEDIDADGIAEIVDTIFNQTQPFYITKINPKSKRNLLTNIKNGHNLTAKIEYELLSEPNGIYTFTQSIVKNCKPIEAWAVKKITLPDGSGNLLNTKNMSYQYKNIFKHYYWGFLGFEQIKSCDNQTEMVTETNYNLTGENRVMPKMTQNYYKLSPNNILTKSVYRYNFNSLLYAPLNLSMNETLDSNFITNQHSSNQKFYDDNGNLTISSFTTSSYNMTRVFSSFINAGSHIPHLPQFMATSTTYKNEQNITAELRTYNNYGQLISSTNNLQTDLDIDTNDISVGYILYPTSGKEVTNTYTYHATYGWLSGTSTSIVGSTPRTASFEYFPNQRTLKKSFNALNQCTQEVLAYSKRYNTPIQIKDLQGNIANTILDTWGRPISTSITYPAGGSIPTSTQSTNTTYNWDIDIATNQLSRTEITHPYGNVSKVYTDNLGRTIKTITKNFNNDDVENKQEFDNFGRVKKEIGYDATDAVVEKNYTYKGIDEHYRLYTISTLFNTTTYETPTYNSNGEATQKVTEGSGAFKEQTTDAAGFLIKSEDNGGTIEYKYNSQGQLTETKVNGVVNNTMTYDAVNGTQTQLDAKSSIMNYKYNSWGELIEQTDNQATPNKYKLEYDILGRLKKRWLDAGEELTEYTYNTTGNGINQVQQITFNGQIDQSFTYDARHRLISQTQRILNNSNVYENYTTSYQYYDADNQLKQITYPENFIVAYQYKANGHLEHIRRDNPTSGAILYKTNSTNRNGQLKTYLSGNGATSTITYLANGMPRIFLAVKNGIILQNLEMDFDNYGNLLSRKDNISTIKQEENFTYNKALDQLKTITTKNNIPTPPISISKEINYATNGNVINKYDAGIPTPNMPSEVTYEYKNLHALEFLKEKCTTADNFIPYKVQHPTPQTIAYTAFNQPNVITENNFNTTFTYNTNYQRTKTVRKLGTTLQNTRYYLGNYEKDVTGTTTRHIYYIYGGNGLCALAVKTGTGAPVYYTAYTDHLGSLVTLTNNNSTPGFVARQSFDAWGRYRTPNNWNDYTVANNSAANSTSGNGILGTNGWLRRGYTMHEHYKEYGLINMNGRMYDPIVGRMLSPDTYVQDPTNSQNYNRYSYVLNNPLKYTDPTGWKYDYKSFYSTYENEETTGDDGGSNFGGGGGGLINPGFNVATWNLISGAWNTASNSGYNYSSFGFTNGVMTSASYNNVYYSNKKGEYGYWSNHNYSINYSTYIVSQWNKLNNEINSATTNNSPTTSTTQSGGWGDNYNIIDDINNATGAGLDAIGGLWSYAEKQSIKNINKEIAPLAKDATFLKSLKYVKTLGTASGIIGITIDGYNLVKQPTIGNALKFIWGIGVIGTGPIGGIADGLFEASGYKDKMFNGIDNLIINKK